jgi:CheY-like chemotaxis protein
MRETGKVQTSVCEASITKLSSKRALVVEDEFLVAMMIVDMLVDLGCEVVGTATTLKVALEKSSALALDFAVLDVNLNGELSYPAADILASRGIPFLFATGYNAKGLATFYQSVPRLQKPFDIKALEKAITNVVKE